MKTRFDSLDVCAMVSHLQGTFTDRRVVNIYDGGDPDTYVFKFDKAIVAEAASSRAAAVPSNNDSSHGFVLIESGKRFHPLVHFQSEASVIPSPFAAKLRKHLRGLRLTRVFQVGTDRVIVFSFASFHLILELYDKGNLILCDSKYKIMALLRSHVYNNTKEQGAEGSTQTDAVAAVQVGHVYPVAYATTITEKAEPTGFLGEDTCVEWAKEQILAHAHRKTKKKQGPTLKTLLLNAASGFSHFGPALLEHCILTAQLDPHKLLDENSVDDIQWQSLRLVLIEEGDKVLDELTNSAAKGYIRYTELSKADATTSDESTAQEPPDKMFQDFLPYLFLQHSKSLIQSYESFGEAVQDFFRQAASQKALQRQHQLERASQDKLVKVRQDQESRVKALQEEQEALQMQAVVVQQQASAVDAALTVVNSALNSGMNWEQLEQLIQVERDAGNPIASLIHELRLKEDAMILKLYQAEDSEPVFVTVALKESAHANASILFAKHRAAKEKSAKTIDSLSLALKAAEVNAKRQFVTAQKRLKTSNAEGSATLRRKPAWFEKFHWFITSDNYLVLGGKDAHQNEMLVKRYLRPGDAYIHADVFGSTSTILRAKRRRGKDGKTLPAPLSEIALSEAGNFTICRSSAWTSRMITSAWWVESHQVSKTAPSGEYLTVGSFMVRGKKNFLPPAALEMGIAVLFRLGDEESISRHLSERRDFALLALVEATDTENDVGQIGRAEATFQDNGDGEKPRDTLESRPSSDLDIDARPSLANKAVAASVLVDTPNSCSIDQLGTSVKKKGLSARDRRMMKKFGSLDDAEKVLPKGRASTSEALVSKALERDQTDRKDNEGPKRGKKAKMKRAKIKYGDQDEEDRILAMLALQGGEKTARQAARSTEPTMTQGQMESETAALLGRDVTVSLSKLPERVQGLLADCVTVSNSDGSESSILREKLDPDTLEQLATLETEAQVAAVLRLGRLLTEKKVENISACLGGILRMIRKYGHEEVNETNGVGNGKAPTDMPLPVTRSKETVEEGGVEISDVDDDAVDDTSELNKLTGKPHPDDRLLYALPVCAPYHTLSQYLYRVKLTPGSMKRGKASKQCVEMLTKVDSKSSSLHERCANLIKGISESDWVQAMCPDVKITSPGASKVAKGKKGKNK